MGGHGGECAAWKAAAMEICGCLCFQVTVGFTSSSSSCRALSVWVMKSVRLRRVGGKAEVSGELLALSGAGHRLGSHFPGNND